MAFNITDVLHNGLRQGGARPSLFKCDIVAPFGSTGQDRVQFLVRAATIPMAQMGVIRVPYFGRDIKLVGDREFPDWTVTVMNDEDFPLRVMFEKWSNLMNTMISNKMSSQVFPTGYKTSGRVTQFGKAGNALRQYIVQGIFPVTVDQMQLDWGNQNTLQEYDVTFAIDWWEPSQDVNTNPDDWSPLVASDGAG